MDSHDIRDAQLIERYLQGKLSAAEEAAFEEAYLADVDLLEQLKLAERLQAGLRDVDAAAPAERPLPRRASWRDVVASPRYGIAASIVAAAALLSSGALLVENRGPHSGFESSGAASPTRLLPLVSVRGGDGANVVTAPAADEWTVLLLDAGFTDYDRYRAVLVRRDAGVERELVRLEGITPTYEGMLAVGLPGRVLTPGEYEVRLAGGRADWPAGRDFDELTRTPLTVTARR